MGTIFDYFSWRGDISFDQVPLNEVDNLIFALLSYIDYDGLVPSEHTQTPVSIQAVANAFFARNPDLRKISLGLIVPKEIVKLLRAARTSRRFRNVGICRYVNEIDLRKEMQFSAMTFRLPGGQTVVAFRGTDDTIVGWKENFNMSFLSAVPAQLRAAEYLNDAADHTEGPIYVTGHSKGGNLSVYAAVKCRPDVKKRLVRVWNNDGPGFSGSMLTDTDYLDTKHLIQSLVPQSSVVGMLLGHDEDYTIVRSRQVGLLQHNGLTWEVLGGSFQKVRTVTDESRWNDRNINQWIREMTPEQREQFSDALYQVLSSGNVLTLSDLANPKNHWLAHSMKLDPKVGKTMSQMLTTLLSVNAKNLLSEWFGKNK